MSSTDCLWGRCNRRTLCVCVESDHLKKLWPQAGWRSGWAAPQYKNNVRSTLNHALDPRPVPRHLHVQRRTSSPRPTRPRRSAPARRRASRRAGRRCLPPATIEWLVHPWGGSSPSSPSSPSSSSSSSSPSSSSSVFAPVRGPTTVRPQKQAALDRADRRHPSHSAILGPWSEKGVWRVEVCRSLGLGAP